MTDLATEEARAMSGRPAWRVAAACVKGVACPRCEVAAGARCNGKTTCRERVWRQRAQERARSSCIDSLGHAFVPVMLDENLAAGSVIWWHPQAGEWRLPETAGANDISPEVLAEAIRGGLVRLAISGGIMPAWVVTEWGHSLAIGWADARSREAAPSAQPVAHPVDAAAAMQAFLERGKP